MKPYTLETAAFPHGKLISIKGYVNKEAAEELSATVISQLKSGIKKLCIDLS